MGWEKQTVWAQKVLVQKVPAQKVPAQKVPAQKVPAWCSDALGKGRNVSDASAGDGTHAGRVPPVWRETGGKSNIENLIRLDI